MCCSFHHHDQPLQVRLWIESGHHLLEGTIACAFALVVLSTAHFTSSPPNVV